MTSEKPSPATTGDKDNTIGTTTVTLPKTSYSVTPILFDGLRDHFPDKFVFGAATSAFQVEGAANEDGKGPSIWDVHCFKKGWNGGSGIDHYHRYKEDVGLMKWMGLDAYRFSISWSRIFPDATGEINLEGVKFYRDLLRELRDEKITPYVTLFHWDIPQALEDEMGGFRNPKIVGYFKYFADICFKFFGGEVKHWITFNEPHTFCEQGYILGTHAPGRRSKESNEPHIPYLVAHHQLLAHAAVVDLYKKNYKAQQKGEIGITLNAAWVEAYNNQSKIKFEKNVKAASRALDFSLNWFLYPLTRGEYPKEIVKKLKEFEVEIDTESDEFKLVKNSVDFIGINYYTAFHVKDDQKSVDDHKAEMVWGEPLGTLHKDAVQWIRVYPQGLKKLLLHVNKEYQGPIYITENGYGQQMNNQELQTDHLQVLNDSTRVSYYHQHLSQIMQLTDQKSDERVNVKGYFAWSLFDNFEWNDGFEVRFGSIYVDHKDNMKRTPKFSAHWLKYMLEKPRNNLELDDDSGSEIEVVSDEGKILTGESDLKKEEDGSINEEVEKVVSDEGKSSAGESDLKKGKVDPPANQ